MPETSPSQILFVVKSAGHAAVYEPEKLQASLRKALQSAGVGDALTARALFQLIDAFLAAEHASGRVASADIRRMVDRVLRETGMEVVAARYQEAGDRRHFIRAQIEVRCELRQTDLFADAAAIGVERVPWDKARILRALQRRGVEPRRAAAIAKAVENQVIDSGVRTLSTALIAAWVDNELLQSACEQPAAR